MGIFNDYEKQTMKTGKCEKGDKGDPGLSIKGDPGKDAMLPTGIILDTGFIMKNNIDMGKNEIVNGAYPSRPTDFCIRKYVDDNTYLPPSDLVTESNANFKADIHMNNHRITNLKIGINPSDAISLQQTTDFIKRSGDYMHGTLSMAGGSVYHSIIGLKDSGFDHSLVTKKYVDDVDSQKISKYGDYVHGDLNFDQSDGTMHTIFGVNMNDYNHCLATKKYVDDGRTIIPDIR